MKSWQRPKPCGCSGYWFPHRLGSGACERRANQLPALNLLAARHGWSAEELLEAKIDWIVSQWALVRK